MADSLILLIMTLIMLFLLIMIGIKTYRKKNKHHYEQPKYRMLDDD